jgi:hypothetical protein
MKIVVNGREYSSPDQMPPDVRAGYEQAMSVLADKNGNGIPDILEMQLDPAKLSAAMSGASPGTTVITGQKFVINGREYDSVEQMPQSDKRHYEQLQALLPDSKLPPVRKTLDPLDPAEWTPNRGLLATNPLLMILIGLVLGAIVTAVVLAALGALK